MEEIIKYLEDREQNNLANQLRAKVQKDSNIESILEIKEEFSSYVISQLTSRVSRDKILTNISNKAKELSLI